MSAGISQLQGSHGSLLMALKSAFVVDLSPPVVFAGVAAAAAAATSFFYASASA